MHTILHERLNPCICMTYSTHAFRTIARPTKTASTHALTQVAHQTPVTRQRNKTLALSLSLSLQAALPFQNKMKRHRHGSQPRAPCMIPLAHRPSTSRRMRRLVPSALGASALARRSNWRLCARRLPAGRLPTATAPGSACALLHCSQRCFAASREAQLWLLTSHGDGCVLRVSCCESYALIVERCFESMLVGRVRCTFDCCDNDNDDVQCALLGLHSHMVTLHSISAHSTHKYNIQRANDLLRLAMVVTSLLGMRALLGVGSHAHSALGCDRHVSAL